MNLTRVKILDGYVRTEYIFGKIKKCYYKMYK